MDLASLETKTYTTIPNLIDSWVIVQNKKTKETERIRLSELIKLIRVISEC